MEWVLAFPRAPTGGVSVQVWGIACVSVIGMVGEGVQAGWKLLERKREGGQVGGRERSGREKEEGLAFKSGSEVEGKKEL